MNRISKRLRNFGVILVAVVAVTLVPPAYAGSHGRHGGGHGRGHHHHGGHHGHAHSYHRNYAPSYGWHGYPGTFVAVPRTIYGGWVDPYYSGWAYYAPHHHRHMLYRYPVWVGGNVVYRSYPYCGSHMFVSASFPLPQIVIGAHIGH